MYDLFTNKEVSSIADEISVEKKELPHIVFIHGAGCSHRSWNYLLAKLNPTQYTMLEYSVDDKFNTNLTKLASDFGHIHDKKVYMISHSMGGIYALNLYQMFRHRIIGSISIATPFAGSRTADFVKYVYPSYALFKDVGVKSAPILRCHNITIHVPWTQIVTTDGGVPWHNGHNDGVVTVESQKHREDMEFVEVHVTHNEALVSDEVLDVIKDKLNIKNT
jgi:pimeloyl-ACP methyl ester carboxylesterase|tara:strand:- start:18631 stop:19290 length:660 start_codon:yes stop_codon:yes gene_type:complete